MWRSAADGRVCRPRTARTHGLLRSCSLVGSLLASVRHSCLALCRGPEGPPRSDGVCVLLRFFSVWFSTGYRLVSASVPCAHAPPSLMLGTIDGVSTCNSVRVGVLSLGVPDLRITAARSTGANVIVRGSE